MERHSHSRKLRVGEANGNLTWFAKGPIVLRARRCSGVRVTGAVCLYGVQ
jgi:hypothetical protein